MKLTERRIETLTVERGQKDRLVFDDAQRGFAVRVTASGGQTYLCQYTLHGQKWRVPLGACSAVALSKAREAAAVVMGDVAKGRNPAAERKAAVLAERERRLQNRFTLRALIENWKVEHLAERRPRYAAETVRALHHAFANYLDLPAESLDRGAVVRVLDTMKRRRKRNHPEGEDKLTGKAIVGRTVAYGRAAYAWSIKRGSVKVNPFAKLPVATSIDKRDRVLSDEELTAIWRATGNTGFPFGTIVRLLLLTGQRREEVGGMTWAELSDDLATWTIPGARTKNGAPHIVPMSEPARALLRSLPRQSRLVLPGERTTPFGGWSKCKARLDAVSSVSDWRLHDLRRTLATGLQRLGVRLEVTEAVLNHISGSRGGIAGVYQRHDWAAEKRAALDAWAAHVLAAAGERTSAVNVVSLARAG
jgi:integrase